MLDLLREHFLFTVLFHVIGPRGERLGRRIKDLARCIASFLVPRVIAEDSARSSDPLDADSEL